MWQESECSLFATSGMASSLSNKNTILLQLAKIIATLQILGTQL